MFLRKIHKFQNLNCIFKLNLTSNQFAPKLIISNHDFKVHVQSLVNKKLYKY